MTDAHWMKMAIELAECAFNEGEVPVGAIVVKGDQVIGRGYNRREKTKNAIEHAELLAIANACETIGDWRLNGCSLYVTLEPCPMCAGAIINSRIERVVVGSDDALAGCCGSVLNLNAYPFNHAFAIQGGVCAEECRALLQEFFARQRAQKK